ncbi:MAG: hypothetical protein KatS3mg065_0782 [Chloroflexota bacterium]|nr:MAG: hypothetical protein KatS3mg065_0782 [Chloroflexota bacterium]
MADLHTALAGLGAVLGAASVLVGIGLAATGRGPDRLLLGLLGVLVATLALNGLVGLAQMAQAGPPRESLHLLYGVGAVLAIPLAVGLAVGRPPRRQAVVLTVGAVVVLGLLLRLFQTGA